MTHFFTSLVRTLRQAPQGALSNILPATARPRRAAAWQLFPSTPSLPSLSRGSSDSALPLATGLLYIHTHNGVRHWQGGHILWRIFVATLLNLPRLCVNKESINQHNLWLPSLPHAESLTARVQGRVHLASLRTAFFPWMQPWCAPMPLSTSATASTASNAFTTILA